MASSTQQNHQGDDVTFGATINDTPSKSQNYLAPNVFDTPKSSLSPVATRDSPTSADAPLTPFYASPSTQTSSRSLPTDAAAADDDLESARKEGYVVTTNPLDSQLDLPAEMVPVSAIPTGHKLSIDGRTKECRMWPTKQTLRDQDRKERSKRRAAKVCGCSSINAMWHDMTRKQRLWFKILLAAFLVAIAVGLGIGISKAVGAGVFAGDGHSKPIADV